jgi:hypothetical protein
MDDDDDSDPVDAPLPATPAAFDSLCVPDFVDAHDPDNPQSKKELEEGNWVTVGLELELKECLPTRVDVSLDGDNRCDSQSLLVAASRMFPVGRIFASSKQLEQVCRRFADAWAFQITHSGKNRSRRRICNGSRRRICNRSRGSIRKRKHSR